MKKFEPPVHINQILKLTVDRFSQEGNPLFKYKNFIIFLNDKKTVNVNEFVKIRIVKILPTFAIAELVE